MPADGAAAAFHDKFARKIDRRCPVENPTLLAGNERVTRYGCDAISKKMVFVYLLRLAGPVGAANAPLFRLHNPRRCQRRLKTDPLNR